MESISTIQTSVHTNVEADLQLINPHRPSMYPVAIRTGSVRGHYTFAGWSPSGLIQFTT